MSRLPFELLLAFRYLRPKRTYVSVITLISIIGVMLGVAVLIVVISVMTGFDRQLRDRILGFNAHIRIQTRGPMRNHDEVAKLVTAHPEVKGASPFVIGPILVQTEPSEDGSSLVEAPIIRGIDPKRERSVTFLLDKVIDGKPDVSGNGILVGSDLARRMGVSVGDRLLIYSLRELRDLQKTYKEGNEEVPLADEYEIRGIFDVGYYEFNDKFIICSLGNAQDIYGLNSDVNGVFAMLRDPSRAEVVKEELWRELGGSYYVFSWEDDNAPILDALLVEKNVMTYLLFFIIIVAAFGIMSVLITFVVQKTREIGMLKALGATSGQVMWLFLSQSLVVGFIGVIMGFGLGLLAVAYRNEFLFLMRRLTDFELFPVKVYGFTELPAVVDPRDIAIICGGSLLGCLIAGLLPAWNAGRLKPVDALRHE